MANTDTTTNVISLVGQMWTSATHITSAAHENPVCRVGGPSSQWRAVGSGILHAARKPTPRGGAPLCSIRNPPYYIHIRVPPLAGAEEDVPLAPVQKMNNRTWWDRH
jgi:hypothetical protein